VHPAILWTVVGTGLAVAATGLVLSVLDRVADRLLLGVTALAEVAVVVQAVVAGIGLATGHDVRSVPTVAGYLAGSILILPFALAWAWADRSRWSGAVVALGGLTVAVMTGRLLMLWDGRA
jgi:hypothetical protein